jgi:hypothetical protein
MEYDKVTTSNKSNLDKKLLAYSLVAGAVLAGGKGSQAAVVHTNVLPDEVVLKGGSFEIDFGTGVTKFKFRVDTFSTTTTAVYNLVNVFGGTASANASWRGGSGFKTQGPEVLNYLDPVQNTNWGQLSEIATPSYGNMATYLSAGSKFGNFIGVTDKYLGVRFHIGAQPWDFYGWIRVDVASDASSVTIKSYAYENVGEVDINAGEGDPSLAVHLLNFTVQQYKNGLKLDWSTASEVNNLGFIIKRRLKGEPEWEEIASYKNNSELRSGGNTSNTTYYSFIDNNVEGEEIYQYMLISVDTDLLEESFDIVEASVYTENIPAEIFLLEQNFPNPFNPETTIKFGLPVETHVLLTIYNLEGKVVEVLKNEIMEAKYHEVKWDASKYGAGTYLYELKADNKREIKKMTLIR